MKPGTTQKSTTEVSGSAGATLRLTALVELGLRAIRTIYVRKDLRRAPIDIWLKSAFSCLNYVQNIYDSQVVFRCIAIRSPSIQRAEQCGANAAGRLLWCRSAGIRLPPTPAFFLFLDFPLLLLLVPVRVLVPRVLWLVYQFESRGVEEQNRSR